MKGRRMALRIAAAAVLGPLCWSGAAAGEQSLTVVSWGGSYARACVKGYHERFTAETGIAIELEDYNGGLAQIRAQVDVGNVYWDVVDLEIPDLVRGCDEEYRGCLRSGEMRELVGTCRLRQWHARRSEGLPGGRIAHRLAVRLHLNIGNSERALDGCRRWG